MEIRRAIEGDAPDIGALSICVWVDTYATEGVYDKISKFVYSEFTEEKILEVIRNKIVYVATNEDNLTGYIVLSSDTDSKIEIETLYVMPKFQREGVGKQLIQQSLALAGKTIWLSTWELNHRAIAFYNKIGFKETGEIFFDLYGDKIRNVVLEIQT